MMLFQYLFVLVGALTGNDRSHQVPSELSIFADMLDSKKCVTMKEGARRLRLCDQLNVRSVL